MAQSVCAYLLWFLNLKIITSYIIYTQYAASKISHIINILNKKYYKDRTSFRKAYELNNLSKSKSENNRSADEVLGQVLDNFSNPTLIGLH